MKDIIIKVFQYGNIYASEGSLGINYENLQGRLIFDFEDFVVEGTGYLEFERDGEKGLIPLTYENEQYYLEIKSSLLKKEGIIKLQLRITEDKIDNEIPVFKSEVFELEVKEAINATSEIPDEYPEWIDLANTKIKEMDNLNITTERIEDGVNIKVTNKDGSESITKVNDGLPGPKGEQGDPGAVKMEVVDTLPETAETDIIYLLKKENPSDENLYEEYVYTSTGWEHIGDTSVDLSDYYTKEESDIKYHYTGIGDISINENNEIGITTLTDETINILQLTPGLYNLSGPSKIEYKGSRYNVGAASNNQLLLVWYDNANRANSGILFNRNDGSVLFTDDWSRIELNRLNSGKILFKDNRNTWEPTNDYNPTTKKYVDDKTGDLTELSTEEQSSLVGAINEVNNNSELHTYTIYDSELSLADLSSSLSADSLNKISIIFNKNNGKTIVLNIVDKYKKYLSLIPVVVKDSYKTSANYTAGFPGYKQRLDGDFLQAVIFDCRYSTNSNGDVTFSSGYIKTTSTIPSSRQVLTKTNTTEYTPTADYHPSTKKYVDDSVASNSASTEQLIFSNAIDDNTYPNSNELFTTDGTSDANICEWFSNTLTKMHSNASATDSTKISGILLLTFPGANNNGISMSLYYSGGDGFFRGIGRDNTSNLVQYNLFCTYTNSDGNITVTNVRISKSPIGTDLTTYPNYDSSKNMVLKSVNGTISWVEE